MYQHDVLSVGNIKAVILKFAYPAINKNRNQVLNPKKKNFFRYFNKPEDILLMLVNIME